MCQRLPGVDLSAVVQAALGLQVAVQEPHSLHVGLSSIVCPFRRLNTRLPLPRLTALPRPGICLCSTSTLLQFTVRMYIAKAA